MNTKGADFMPTAPGSKPLMQSRLEVFYRLGPATSSGDPFTVSPGVRVTADGSVPLGPIAGGAVPQISNWPLAFNGAGVLQLGKDGMTTVNNPGSVDANKLGLFGVGLSYLSKITPVDGWTLLARADGRRDYYPFRSPVPAGLPLRVISATAGLKTKALKVDGPTQFVLLCVGFSDPNDPVTDPEAPAGFDNGWSDFTTDGIFMLSAGLLAAGAGTYGPYTIAVDRPHLAAATIMLATVWDGVS
jgi:hypothetical protein